MTNYVVACDVDGCLRNIALDDIVANERIRSLVIILSSFKNVTMVVWSGRGADYAQEVVEKLGLSSYVKKTYTKGDIEPDIAIDDQHEFSLGKINLIVREIHQQKKSKESSW